MFDQAQLRKGTLEGCILKIIDREPTYGYAIATTLRDCGFADLTEGTLYPLLLRLERKGLIAAEYRAGSGGPSRKYYRLTPDGVQYLNEFTEAWQNASDTVNRILHDKEGCKRNAQKRINQQSLSISYPKLPINCQSTSLLFRFKKYIVMLPMGTAKK